MNDDLKLDDTWTGAEGSNAEGIPVLVRYRRHLQSFRDTGTYNTKIDIVWSYDTDEAAMMPAPGEAGVMDNFENRLLEALEGDNQSILVAVITGEGEKAWSWYTTSAGVAQDRIDYILEDFETLPINITQTNDPDWEEYFKFIVDFGGAA